MEDSFFCDGLEYMPFTEEDCDALEMAYGSLYWVDLPHANDYRIMLAGCLIDKKPKDKQNAMIVASKFITAQPPTDEG